jgi:hypothetical protein
VRASYKRFPGASGPGVGHTCIGRRGRSQGSGRCLRALAVSLSLGAMTCHQAVSPLPISGTLRAHLEDERFDMVTSIGGLPHGVRDGLQELFGSASLDIAEPGAEFQGTDGAGDNRRPSRRLVAAGCSTDHCLVYYERGGTTHACRVALFRWAPDATRFEWGGAAPADLTVIDDVRNAVLSGEIMSPDRSW